MRETDASVDKIDAKPLYVQVQRALSERIHSGVWEPGRPLPNEFQLAAEFGVSQGTVRKALDALAAEHLVERHQGRGTFVARHTSDTVHFRFFQLYDPGGRIHPESRDVQVAVATADADERAALALEPKGRVIRITRTRTHADRPIIDERISIGHARSGSRIRHRKAARLCGGCACPLDRARRLRLWRATGGMARQPLHYRSGILSLHPEIAPQRGGNA